MQPIMRGFTTMYRSSSCAGFFAAATIAAASSVAPLAAQEAERDAEAVDVLVRPTATAGYRSEPIEIDGLIDDPGWSAAETVSGFTQGEPVEGIPADEDTEVRILFDDDAIYVSARMFDSEPEKIGTRLARRDERGSFDEFTISLDPNLDGLTGYAFRISAAGVQRDVYLFNDDQEDDAWDAVWDSEVVVDEEGWTAEIRIPLSQIRYESGSEEEVQSWGVNFSRRRLSSNERSYFALKSRIVEGRVSQFGMLDQVRVTGASRRIEIRPYVLSNFHRGPFEDGDPFFDGEEFSARTGADLRLGLGSAFTADATINPDFGQVEADPAVINLSAFETFFEERRPFFVEDAQVFDFNLSGGQNQLFYSRRIGRAPSGRAPFGTDYDDIPDAATILGAAKVTGRTSSGLSIGALAAMTDEETGRGFSDDDGAFSEFMVEPRAQYGVFRLQKDFDEGMTTLGGIVTGLHRDLPDDRSFAFLPDQAYSLGMNFEHQWANREWAVRGYFAGSQVLGDSTAITRIQRSSNHYFQRPDATRLSVDSAATSMMGSEWRLTLSKQSGQHWTGAVWASDRTPSFEVNDLGFNNGRERLDLGMRLNYREIEPNDLFRNYNFTFSSFQNWSREALDDVFSIESWQAAHLMETYRLDTRATFLNYWSSNVNLAYYPDHWSFDKTRGGPAMLDPGSWSIRAGLNSDSRKPISVRSSVNIRRGFRNSGDETTFSGTIDLKPTPQLQLQVQPRFSTTTTADQYVTSTSSLSFDPTFGRRYLFGDLERKSFSMVTRVNWSFSPRLSFQLFAQPLLSSGDYQSYKQLAEPRTFDFVRWEEGEIVESEGGVTCSGGQICVDPEGDQNVDFDGDGTVDFTFSDRDFNIRSLVGNAVVRWEYRPGSTVFFVWQRNQRARADVGDFDFDRDFDALLSAPADDRFIVKVNYWLGL